MLSRFHSRLIISFATVIIVAIGSTSFAGGSDSTELLSSAQKSFDSGVLAWEGQGNTVVTLDQHSGQNSSGGLVVLVNRKGNYQDSSKTARVGTPQYSNGIAASGGYYKGSAYVRGFTNSVGQARCEIRAYNDGTILTTIESAPLKKVDQSWTRLDCAGDLPNGTKQVALRVFIADARYGETFIVDNTSLIKTNNNTSVTSTVPVITTPYTVAPTTNPPTTKPPATQPLITQPPTTQPSTSSGTQPTKANTGPRYALTDLPLSEFYKTRTCNRQRISGEVSITEPSMKGQTFNFTDCEIGRLVVYIQSNPLTISEMPIINMKYTDMLHGIIANNAARLTADYVYVGDSSQLVLKTTSWAPFIEGPAPYTFTNSVMYGAYLTQPNHTEAAHIADYGSGYRFTNVAFIQQGGSMSNTGVTAVINFHGRDSVFDGCYFLWDGPTPTFYVVYIDGPNNVVKNSYFGSGAGYVYPEYAPSMQATYINNKNYDTGAALNLP